MEIASSWTGMDVDVYCSRYVSHLKQLTIWMDGITIFIIVMLDQHIVDIIST